MLTYPVIDPVALKLGPVQIYWYGLMFILGFVGGWALAQWRIKRTATTWTTTQVSDLMLYVAVGVVLGGRIGYMLFYDFHTLVTTPLETLKIWHGGMSFHGGFLGVLFSLALFAKHYRKKFFDVTDFVAPFVAIGLAAGRIGNFINGELWGRTSDVSWAMVFPRADEWPRHPSQLYEFLLEGVVLFAILFFFSLKPRPRFAASALFLTCYGAFRFFIEFFREPDAQIGFIALDWMTMGQLLSIPMLLVGLASLAWIYCSRRSLCSSI